MTITVITPPAVQPVTLAQIKQHLRIEHTEDDGYLAELSAAATAHVETYLRQALIKRTLRQYVDNLPADRAVVLRASPVQSVVEVTAFDRNGNAETINGSEYELKRQEQLSSLVLNSGFDPERAANGIEIDLVAGYGESGVDVPSSITRALLVLISAWYEVRGSIADTEATALVPEAVERLLAPMRRMHL